MYEEDEIDLRELFKIIWNKKWFILIFTFVITFASVIYVYFKNPIPIYQGSILVEIGEIQSETFGSRLLDNPQNLSTILNKKFDIKSTLPKRTNNLINIIATSTNEDEIKSKIIEVVSYIKSRHEIKSNFYKDSIKTKEIGNINIASESINKPKKKLIVVVSFVTAFILSIFIVFFMSFIGSFRNEDKKDLNLNT